MRYFIVKDNIIVNIVVWDGIKEWKYSEYAVLIPDGCMLGIGDTWSGV